ncbi:Ataxin-10 [Sesamum angolense]|uniref:Ataxin-10 n=1 Tax=Sesamum angolense TaxID=2727404 RepID=A0AAE2BYC5_9LAMI|nr:Ataxin-10 [Sesamum angolense]
MDDTVAPNFSVPNNVLALLFIASHSSTLNEALECLIETAKSSDGRLDLASKGVLLPVLELCRSASQLSGQDLLLSIKLLRNLCAGEITNQNLFIEQNGVEILSTIISSMALTSGLDNGILRSSERSVDLLSDQGMDIIIEIIRTVTVAGFRENWVKLLLSRICLEESYFWTFFSKLSPVAEAENSDDNVSQINHFGAQQAFLLRILSEILNEWIGDIVVPNEFSSCIFQILRNAVGVVDFNTRGKSSLPTGSGDIDVIGYTLSILRDISASGGPKVANQDEKGDAVDTLVSAGLIKFLITLLRDLEPPAIIRKAMIPNEAKDGTTSQPFKYCPYRDEDNPFLREWGIWSMRNVLEGNTENQQLVANLELQGSVDVPEIAGLGLRVEVDPKTRRPKLVNAS